MSTHTFTLVIAGVDLDAPGVEDLLFEGGLDDAILATHAGVTSAEFDREATTFAGAVVSAIRDIQNAIPGARVLRIEPDDLVSLAAIATRTGRTSESVRLLTHGTRGPGGFPRPTAVIDKRTKLWSWLEVLDWFHQTNQTIATTSSKAGTGPGPNAQDAKFIAAMNGLLTSGALAASITEPEQRDALAALAYEEATTLNHAA